jgi:acetyl-CoA carboxylase biotin carboxyl carrier protein
MDSYQTRHPGRVAAGGVAAARALEETPRAAFPLDALSPVLLACTHEACLAGLPLAPPHSQSLFTVDLQEIRRIVELMNEHGLTHFDLTKKDFHLKLKKGADLDDLRALMGSLPSAGHAPAPAAAVGTAPAAPAAEGTEITSPMVGTFYQKPAPDAPNFVEVGTPVSIGQTICIIEAMKVMNEIKAEKSGTICAVVAEDCTPVQYGDVLFRIK